MSKTAEILEAVKGMTVLELAELVKVSKKNWSQCCCSCRCCSCYCSRAAAAPAAEEQTDFDVVLMSAGAAKIYVIKVVREITGRA
jgi:large subunit ribosomal protein L7/L12